MHDLETPKTPKGVCPSIMGSRLVFPLGYGMLAFRLEPWIHNCTSRLPQVKRVTMTAVSLSCHAGKGNAVRKECLDTS